MPVRMRLQFLWAAGFLALLAACGGDQQSERPWSTFVLQRHQPHDGLAVVSQPDGYGLHIFLETDTSNPAICRPRWIPDPARLFNGNGSAPFSSGIASRDEFFEAMQKPAVLKAARRELEQLCLNRAPDATWQWVDPPLAANEISPLALPAWEEQHLLTNPVDELKRETSLFDDSDETDDPDDSEVEMNAQ